MNRGASVGFWALGIALSCVGCAGRSTGLATAAQPAPPIVAPSRRPVAVMPASFPLAQAAAVPAPARLPVRGPDVYQQALEEAHRTLLADGEGRLAAGPQSANPRLYGIVVATVDGAIYEIGDARQAFPAQQAGRLFTLARALEVAGPQAVASRVGVAAIGPGMGSVLALELGRRALRNPAGNPLIDAGAIATVDLVAAPSPAERWKLILGTMNAFAGRPLVLDEDAYQALVESDAHDRAVALLLRDYGTIEGDPLEALEVFQRQGAVSVNARDLAIMGATLAAGGMNPVTGERAVREDTARRVLALMTTAGLDEETGTWLFRVGVPACAANSGGMLAVVPGRFAIGAFSPLVDEGGQSVRGRKAIEMMIARLDANLFTGRPGPGAARSAAQRRPLPAW